MIRIGKHCQAVVKVSEEHAILKRPAREMLKDFGRSPERSTRVVGATGNLLLTG
jgi:hypothetical protein